jgi:hypothetical protein
METNKFSKPIGKTDKPNSRVVKTQSGVTCVWGGLVYSPGANLCVPDSNGMQWQYVCGTDGSWVNTEILCSPE